MIVPDKVIENRKKIMGSNLFGDRRESPRRRPQAQEAQHEIRPPPPVIEKSEYEQVRKSYDPGKGYQRFNFLIPPKTNVPKIENVPPRLPLPVMQPFPEVKLETHNEKPRFDMGIKALKYENNFKLVKMPLRGIDDLHKIKEEINLSNIEFAFKLNQLFSTRKNMQFEPNQPPSEGSSMRPESINANEYPTLDKLNTQTEYIDPTSTGFAP